MYLCDTHTHSLVSPDSDAPLEAMVQAAMVHGLHELCVTDHCDLLDAQGGPVTGFDWTAAWTQYRAVKQQTGDKLRLRMGLELGSAVCDPPVARRILAEGGEDLDFVLGSLHNWIGMEGQIDLYFSSFHTRQLCRQAMENCLDSTWKLVTGCPDCYDSLAHIIYPLRYMERDGQHISLSEYEEQMRAIFTQVAQTGHAMEVNTYRGRTLSQWLPLLRWFHSCGGEFVTLGSDAHRPEDVAKGIREGCALLQEAGFAYVTTFYRRKPVPNKL